MSDREETKISKKINWRRKLQMDWKKWNEDET